MDLTEKQVAAFWAKADKRGADECWNWTAYVIKNSAKHVGYGMFGVGKGTYLATHVSLTLDGHPRPGKLLALHSCNNPRCVNPRHLRWGTHYDNTLDSVAAGKRRVAISDADAAAIRSDPRPRLAIAADFGCSVAHVGMIQRGESHKVKEPA